MMARLADLYKDMGGITTTGTATAYVVATNRAFASSAIMDGAVICIKPNADSGASPTLAVDGLTARAINYSTGVAIPTGALKTGTPYQVIYIHASTEFILLGALSVDATTVALSQVNINGGTAETAPDTADLAALYDASATANRKMTLANLFKVINTFAAEASPATDDQLLLYDTSAGTADKLALSVLAASATVFKPPTRQVLTSGTAATYTTPTGCKAIVIKMVGGGGGGGAVGTNAGSTGGNTIFNSVEANGGAGGAPGSTGSRQGGVGGTGGSGSALLRLSGANGHAGNSGASAINVNSGGGGVSPFGGAGPGSTESASVAAKSNTGSGGGGACGTTSASAGGGGGAGEYVEMIIASPSATYTYTIGAGGSGGSAGTVAGGAGGSGLIIVEEYY